MRPVGALPTTATDTAPATPSRPALDTVRVPASDMAHLFQALAPGRLRGITWLAPVLLRLHELDQYEDAALVKAKVAALFTGFIRDPDGTVAGLNPRLWRRLHRLAWLVRERRRVMTDLAQLEAWRDALLRARYAGLRTVEIEGRRVSYATDAEMATALADLERRIATAQSGRVRQVRIQSTKVV